MAGQQPDIATKPVRPARVDEARGIGSVGSPAYGSGRPSASSVGSLACEPRVRCNEKFQCPRHVLMVSDGAVEEPEEPKDTGGSGSSGDGLSPEVAAEEEEQEATADREKARMGETL